MDLKNKYQEFHVDSLEEIYAIIEKYNVFYDIPRYVYEDEKLQPFYRGQSRCDWDISPSILRCSDSEHNHIDNHFDSKFKSLFELIAYIQHYYTGTRFIDFTTDPNVALYFACAENPQNDGALFLYNYAFHKAQWYTTVILCELSKLKNDNKIKVQDFTEHLLITYPELKDIFADVRELNMAIVSFLDNGFMAVPDNDSLPQNIRMRNQKGCFYICGSQFVEQLSSQDRFMSSAGNNYFYPHKIVIPDDLKRGHTLRKIIIPNELKQDILQSLENEKGINKEFLLQSIC